MSRFNMKAFSTFDQDNDGCSLPCAEKHRNGWWYTECEDSYHNSGNYWIGLVDKAEMKIRPIN